MSISSRNEGPGKLCEAINTDNNVIETARRYVPPGEVARAQVRYQGLPEGTSQKVIWSTEQRVAAGVYAFKIEILSWPWLTIAMKQ